MFIYKPSLDAENIVKNGGEYGKRYLAELDAEYKKLITAPIPELSAEKFAEFKRSGSRISYERDYFLRRTMLRDFALKLWLGDKTAAVHLTNIIDAICSETTWILPAHEGKGDIRTQIDLFAAETAQTLTEAVALTGGSLDAETKERAIDEVHTRVLKPFINRAQKYGWERSVSNWSAVCGGCVGMTVLYLIEDKNAVKQLTEPLKEAFENYMRSFADDGACLEGLYYWGYGMIYLTAFLELYRERMGEEFPVNYEKIAKMADFPHKCCITDGVTVSFSDAGCRDKIYAGLSSRLTKEYGATPIADEYLSYFYGDDCGRWCRAARDVAWAEEQREAVLPARSVLPDAEWVVVRGDMPFAIKGGNNGEPHNHNDIGSFMVICDGEPLVIDIGAGEYTKDYFSDKRYTIFCNRSAGHSVPLIDNIEQSVGAEYAAGCFTFEDDTVKMDIAGAYDSEKLQSLVRQIKPNVKGVNLTDTFILTQKSVIRERFIIRDKNSVKRFKTIPPLIPEIKTFPHRTHDGKTIEITAADYIFEAAGEFIFSLIIE